MWTSIKTTQMVWSMPENWAMNLYNEDGQASNLPAAEWWLEKSTSTSFSRFVFQLWFICSVWMARNLTHQILNDCLSYNSVSYSFKGLNESFPNVSLINTRVVCTLFTLLARSDPSTCRIDWYERLSKIQTTYKSKHLRTHTCTQQAQYWTIILHKWEKFKAVSR